MVTEKVNLLIKHCFLKQLDKIQTITHCLLHYKEWNKNTKFSCCFKRNSKSSSTGLNTIATTCD